MRKTVALPTFALLALALAAGSAHADPQYGIKMGPGDSHVAACTASETWLLAPDGPETIMVSCIGERDPWELARLECLYGSHIGAVPTGDPWAVRVFCTEQTQW